MSVGLPTIPAQLYDAYQHADSDGEFVGKCLTGLHGIDAERGAAKLTAVEMFDHGSADATVVASKVIAQFCPTVPVP